MTGIIKSRSLLWSGTTQQDLEKAVKRYQEREGKPAKFVFTAPGVVFENLMGLQQREFTGMVSYIYITTEE